MSIKDNTIEFARSGFAWPGGYPLFAFTNDNACLCRMCVRDNYRAIRESQNRNYNDGWQVVGITVNWENVDLVCDHCGEHIESAYGEDQ